MSPSCKSIDGGSRSLLQRVLLTRSSLRGPTSGSERCATRARRIRIRTRADFNLAEHALSLSTPTAAVPGASRVRIAAYRAGPRARVSEQKNGGARASDARALEAAPARASPRATRVLASSTPEARGTEL